MPLPETIPVKYTEEDAEFVSVRPVVRQAFRLPELLDMILSVTGKDPARIQKVLRGGTIVFHFFRYRWEGFDAPEAELAAALATFPDADPGRAFQAAHCTTVLLETGSHTPPEWKRPDVERRRLWRRKGLWSVLMEMAESGALTYQSYSYDRKADVYALALEPQQRAMLTATAGDLLPAAARGPIPSLAKTQRLLYLCPRP